MKEKLRQVPFGNSVFQIQNFIANAETPERVYRNTLLQYDSKMKALHECQFRRRRNQIVIDEAREKMKDENLSCFDKRRLQVDIDEAQYRLDSEMKLIEDCLIEIKVYEDIIRSLPDFTREDFEKAEITYWRRRLLDDAELEHKSTGTVAVGTLKSLRAIGLEFERNEDGLLECISDNPKKEIVE